MLTVNVCAEMLATPTAAAPVGLSVLKPPSVTVMWLCAGQNPVGFHRNVLRLSHSTCPLGRGDAVMVSARSAAARSATCWVNVMTIGCATPTTSPGAGCTDATLKGGVVVTAAKLGFACPPTASNATAAAATTHLAVLHTVVSRSTSTSGRRGEGAQTMFVCIACVEEIQTVCAGVALGWRRQLHDAEPVVLLVECHHGDELVLVDDVSIE